MKMNILTIKSSSSTIIISMLCLISLLIASCDDIGTSMIPVADPVPDPPDGTHIVDTIDYIKELHSKREELQTVLAKESNTEIVSFPDRLVIPHLDIAKPLESIDQWIYEVNTTEIIKVLNADLEKLQQDIAAVRNQPPGTVGNGGGPPIAEPPPTVGNGGGPPIVVEPPPPPVVEPPPPPVVEPPPPPVVEPPPPPVVEPPVVEPSYPLKVGDRIIIRNTLDLGIRIRSAPNEDRIGGMFDGETGRIISGPKKFRGLTWFEIEWDAPVKNPQSGCGADETICIGWSAEIVEDGTRVIHKRE